MNHNCQIKKVKMEIEKLQKRLEELEAIKEVYVVIVKHEEYRNWYKTGQVYKVHTSPINHHDGAYYPTISDYNVGIGIEDCVVITDPDVIAALDAAKIGE